MTAHPCATCGHAQADHYHNFISGTACKDKTCGCTQFVSSLPLLPCPFCGSTEVHITKNHYIISVICSGCGASSGLHENEIDARAAWNTRQS